MPYLIVDENIALADQAFGQFGKVTLLPGRKISNSELKDADILIVRSITNVNEELLKNTSVKFVGTTTIGTDHIDLRYLSKNKISFADAKGCNAYSVAEYVIAAILNLAVRFDFSLKNKSIGIVGVGNIGNKVAVFANALGMNVLLNDPPLKRSGDKRKFVELNEIFKCDIITLHVPLNLTGVDKTYHLFDKENIKKIKENAILINTSRGAVINNQDLLSLIDKKNLKVVLDVWENEPDINLELLKKVQIATPHIAGYSYEGKVNGTKIIYDSLCRFLGAEKSFQFNLSLPHNPILSFEECDKIEKSLDKLVSTIYAIKEDDKRMRKILDMKREELIIDFDKQRKNYPRRREFNNYTVISNSLSDTEKKLLTNLRFNVS